MAVVNVKPGQAESFRAAFKTAEPIIAAAPGFCGLELRRCVEDDHRFLLLVHWDTVASHEVGFRGSPEYQKWKQLLHHFYEPFPTVEHFLPMTGETAGPV
jgi:heme-degrading monooxygenase HmoA